MMLECGSLRQENDGVKEETADSDHENDDVLGSGSVCTLHHGHDAFDEEERAEQLSQASALLAYCKVMRTKVLDPSSSRETPARGLAAALASRRFSSDQRATTMSTGRR